MSDENSSKSTKSSISLFLKDEATAKLKNSAFNFERPNKKDISLESPHLLAKFSSSGVLRKIYLKKSGMSLSTSLDFKAYIPKEYRSGAYLFQPESNEPLPISNLTDNFPLLCIVKGPVSSELIIVYHNFLTVILRIFNFEESPTALQLEVSSDISKAGRDMELVMRVTSGIKNNDDFFSDSNGLQMLKRKYVSKLPIQGNYYPATSAIYIEDNSSRLSLLTSFSHGVTSPESGALELMIDRRMKNDDSRGMGEGVLDNRMVTSTFWLVPETAKREHTAPASLSLETHFLSLCLQYPLITLVTDNGEARITKSDLSFLSSPWPSGVHLVNLRNLPSEDDYEIPSNKSLMVLYERFDNCKTKSFVDTLVVDTQKVSFSEVKIRSIVKTSLTGTIHMREENVTSSSKLQACEVEFHK